MASDVSMGLARKLDTFGGLLVCAVLYAYGRLRARLGGAPLPERRATTPPTLTLAEALPGAPDSPEPSAPLQRILVIKTYGLGNMAILMPVLAALRRAYPGAAIDMVTLDSNCGLIERTGLVDETIPFRMSNGFAGALSSLFGIWRQTRRRRYDVVIDFEQFIKLSAIIAFLSGAPRRIGFNTDGQRRGWLYTTRVVYTDSEHMSSIFMRLLLPLGIDAQMAPFEIAISQEENEAVDRLLAPAAGARSESSAGPLIAVHVGSGANFYDVPLKRWPVEHFAGLCDELVSRHGALVVFTGKGSEEQELVARTRALMTQASLDACDRLNVGELLALLRRADFTVSNDTSVMHLSAVVDTPVVAFFGATSPIQYGPLNPEQHLVFCKDLYCSPCITNYNLKVSYCADPICIRAIGVEEVLRGIERRLLPASVKPNPKQEPLVRLEDVRSKL